MNNMFELAVANLTSPIILFFGLGIVIGFAKAKVNFPAAVSEFISIYLLTAIGFKGGAAIAEYGVNSIIIKVLAIILVGAVTPILAFYILRSLGKFCVDNAAAIAGHYGSVSVVTFMAGTIFISNLNISYEGYINGFPAIMEVPGIVVALFLASYFKQKEKNSINDDEFSINQVIKQVILSKSVILLLGAMVVGYFSGANGMNMMQVFYKDIFYGMLSLFMLELGIIAASRLGDLKTSGVFLIIFGTLMPVLNGIIGIIVGITIGLSLGGTTLLAILAASSSYIVAPAAMRISLPKANPALYLGVSVGVTLPFNLIVGIPLYYFIASYMIQLLR